MVVCPCIKCENKGCGSYHDKCELYLEYKKDRERIYNERRVNRDFQDIVTEGIRRGIGKIQKKGRGKD